MAETKVTPKFIVDNLMELAGHTEIVKHIPGQIRLKIKPTGILMVTRMNLMELKASLLERKEGSGILDADANTKTRIVTILYDEKKIPKELWELLIKAKANPKIQQVVRKELIRRMGG